MCICVYIYEYTYSNIVYVCVRACGNVFIYIYMREGNSNSMYTYIYIKRRHMRMDEYVIIICMLGCGGKYNNMWEGRDSRRAPTHGKKERNSNMCVKSGGLTGGGGRKRRRFSRSNGRCSENRTDPVGPTTKCQSLSTG